MKISINKPYNYILLSSNSKINTKIILDFLLNNKVKSSCMYGYITELRQAGLIMFRIEWKRFIHSKHWIFTKFNNKKQNKGNIKDINT